MKTQMSVDIMSDPALLFLYHRIEQILGIRPSDESLVRLNEYLEKKCKYSFIENPAAYIESLNSREDIFEIAQFFTINETYFFREGVHFDVLVRHLLPQLVTLNRPIQICSAATAIGCEAYSIAMLLDYHAKKGPYFEFAVDAFDVSAESIETANNGRYTANALRTDGSDWKYILDLYLVSDGAEYIVSPDIRKKVRFFPHNIMRGLPKKYDVIFFRNALIYFLPRYRNIIVNNIADSLVPDGTLFLGISETASIKHSLLASRHLPDVFFFQKIREGPVQHELKQTTAIPALRIQAVQKQIHQKKADLPIDCGEVSAILKTEEGQPNAEKTLKNIGSGKDLSGAEIAAAVAYFLNIQDFNSADLVLSHLEKYNGGAINFFLRGEYFLLGDEPKKAESYFELAAGKDTAFWPAFYRIASLVEDTVRHEYKVKKACESLALGRDLRYECFMGDFSPDYFRRILMQRITEKSVPDAGF